jgi:hypothetical protein
MCAEPLSQSSTQHYTGGSEGQHSFRAGRSRPYKRPPIPVLESPRILARRSESAPRTTGGWVAAIGLRQRGESSSVIDPEGFSAGATEDVRAAFGPDGDMGRRVIRLLTDLEALRTQLADHTFAETEAERERLEAAKLLLDSARSFIVMSLDQVIADDAIPLSPRSLGWLRVALRWSGAGPPPTQSDVEAAVQVARRCGAAH